MIDIPLLARVEALENERAVRQLITRYFRICDDLGPNTPFNELGELFTADSIWEGKGRYAKAFGRYNGRDAIVAMIRSYCLPVPHFAMTAHFLTAENISVSGSGATGEWMMLQTSDYTDGRADLRGMTVAHGRSAISVHSTCFRAASNVGATWPIFRYPNPIRRKP
jgi:hypothetical protein